MEETGTVVEVEGRIAKIRLLRQATCNKCGMCGIGQHPEIVVEVPNTIGAGPGDAVRLAIESGNVLRAAVVVYVVPLLVAILGFLLASYLAGPAGFPAYREALGIAGAAVGLILSFVWVASYDRQSRGSLHAENARGGQPGVRGATGGAAPVLGAVAGGGRRIVPRDLRQDLGEAGGGPVDLEGGGVLVADLDDEGTAE